MMGFGNSNPSDQEKAKQEQIAQAMKAMSDQIGKQAQTIKDLEDQLAAAKGNEAIMSATSEVLAAAQVQIKQMHDEMEKLKSSAAAPPPHSGGGAISAIGGAKSGVDAHVDAPVSTLGGAAEGRDGGLSVGVTAYVQKAGGKSLRLRDAAGLGSNAFDGLHPGTQMILLAGPVEKDGYPWWHIRAVDGREGWVAGTELVTHPE